MIDTINIAVSNQNFSLWLLMDLLKRGHNQLLLWDKLLDGAKEQKRYVPNHI